MGTFTPTPNHRFPVRGRLLAASAALVVAAVGIAAWAGVSAAGTRAMSPPTTTSTITHHPGGGGSASPAVPNRPTVNPARPEQALERADCQSGRPQ
jgi:hypothetical protein